MMKIEKAIPQHLQRGLEVKPPPICQAEKNGLMGRLPATNVANEVVWAHPKIQGINEYVGGHLPSMPLQLANEGRLTVWGMSGHCREVVINHDPELKMEGISYPWMTAKGVGAIADRQRYKRSGFPELYIDRMKYKSDSAGRYTWGLGYYDWMTHDLLMTQKAAQLDVKAVPIIALIKLDEIIVDGQDCYKVTQPQVQQLLEPGACPGVELRAFTIPWRLSDLESLALFIQSYEEAFVLYDNLLTGIELWGGGVSEDCWVRYLQSLAQIVGRNLGKLHKEGIVHNYLTACNVCLDGSFVDFDSAFMPASQDKIEEEARKFISPEAENSSTFWFFCWKFLSPLIMAGQSRLFNKAIKEIPEWAYKNYLEELKGNL